MFIVSYFQKKLNETKFLSMFVDPLSCLSNYRSRKKMKGATKRKLSGTDGERERERDQCKEKN
jgi:hypothetical protein